MPKIIRLYVAGNLDGILVCPEKRTPGTHLRIPDAQQRVFVAGNSDIYSLTMAQLDALVELVCRDPKIRERARKAIFYDAKVWAEQERRKIVLTHTWT